MEKIISLIAEQPFAGAFRQLEKLDPLWQAEIGEARAWEVMAVSKCYCNCPYCEKRYSVFVEAITVEEAVKAAEGEIGDNDYIIAIRVKGRSYWHRFEP